YVEEGEEQNMKLTYKENIFLLDKLFQLKSEKLVPALTEDIFVGKVVVIFGGSYGIGQAILELLNKLGCTVVSFSRSQNNVDICDAENVAQALKSVYDTHSKIDYVINTAAILIKRPLVTTPMDEIEAIINTNIRGMINVARESHQYLKQTSGALLLYTSSSYTRGRAYYSLYSSTKAAVVNFVQAIATEWSVDKIRVNCINPERTNTPMRVKNFGQEDAQTLLTAEQVAEASVSALLSSDSGQVFDVKLDK
ncbi:MAG: SDR family oxidoreductase, partial [Rikenellaceae bacterium]